MFLAINNDKVYYADGYRAYKEEDKEWLINLNQVDDISFPKEPSIKDSKQYNIEFQKSIIFNSYRYNETPIEILFTKESLGEYNRIKRLIESKVLK